MIQQEEKYQISDEELKSVSGGAVSTGTVRACQAILTKVGITVPDEWVAAMLKRGNGVLRAYALSHSNNNPLCYAIPAEI